jgi:hypothetical protein
MGTISPSKIKSAASSLSFEAKLIAASGSIKSGKLAVISSSVREKIATRFPLRTVPWFFLLTLTILLFLKFDSALFQ